MVSRLGILSILIAALPATACLSFSEPGMLGEPASTTVSVGSSGTTEDPLQWFWLHGEFAYDASTQTTRPFLRDDGGTGVIINPSLEVSLAAQRDLETTLDCSVHFEWQAHLPPPDWVQNSKALAGVDAPNDAVITSSCDNGEDGVDFFLTDAIVAQPWGIGIADVDPEVIAELVSDVPSVHKADDDWSDNILITGMNHRDLPEHLGTSSTFASNGIGYAYKVDETFRERLDAAGNRIPIPATDVYAGEMPSGIYEFYRLTPVSDPYELMF